MIEIFILKLDKVSWNIIDKKLLDFVSETRKIKILKYSSEVDRRLSLYSALLLRKQLSEKLKIPNFSLEFFYMKNRKPIFLNDPMYNFSIAHSGNCAILAISNKCVGCDVEKIRKFPVNLADKIFHPSEIKSLRAILNEKQKIEYFFKVWTQKEAYSKYKGNGIYNNLKSFNTKEKKFLSWKEKEYVFSVFSQFLTDISYKNITEKEIVNYFFNLDKTFNKKLF